MATFIAFAVALTGTLAPTAAQAAVKAAAPTAQYPVSIKNEKLVFTGSIGTRKRKVYLQRRTGKSWKTIVRTRTTKDGAYAIRFRNTARTGTAPKYRVYVNTSKKRLYSASTRLPSVRGTLTLAFAGAPDAEGRVTAVATLNPARPGRSLTIGRYLQRNLTVGSTGAMDANGSFQAITFLPAGVSKTYAFYGQRPAKPIVRSAPVTISR